MCPATKRWRCDPALIEDCFTSGRSAKTGLCGMGEALSHARSVTCLTSN